MIGLKPDKGVHQQLGINVSKNYNHSSVKSKLLKVGKEIACFPDEQAGWFKYALKDAEEFLLSENIDVIVSTSYPVTSHLSGGLDSSAITVLAARMLAI